MINVDREGDGERRDMRAEVYWEIVAGDSV